MTNPIIEALKAALGVLAGILPEKWANLVEMVRTLLGFVKFPASDPRTEKIAEIVAGLLTDLKQAMTLTDATAQEKARLVIENKFLRAWAQLSPGGGV